MVSKFIVWSKFLTRPEILQGIEKEYGNIMKLISIKIQTLKGLYYISGLLK